MAATHEDRNAQLSPGVAIKAPCRVATTGNIVLNGEQTIDGVATVTGDRVLVKNQTNQTANGIYLVSTSSWTREPDFDGNRDVVLGSVVKVVSGTIGAGWWGVTTVNPITFGSSNIAFAQDLISDSSTISFTQSGVGAVVRTAQNKVRENLSILDFTTPAQAIAAGANRTLFLPNGTIALGSTGIVLPQGIRLLGDSRGGTQFTYSGTGDAIDGYTNGASEINLENFTVTTTNDAANCIHLGNACQHIYLNQIETHGNNVATQTGTGLLLESAHVNTAFSGQLYASGFYSQGNKFGIRFKGDNVNSNRTWTTCSFDQAFLIGLGLGVAGSFGISIDADTNLSGSSFIGGTVEAFAVGLNHVANSAGLNSGIEFIGDIEGCSTSYVIGLGFQGRIDLNAASDRYTASTNGTANRWHRELYKSGFFDRETRGSQRHIVGTGGAPQQEFSVYIADASFIDGGSPTFGFGFVTDGTFATPQNTYIRFGTRKMTWGSAPPTGGTWGVGDIEWNTGAVAGGSPGWVCTTAGTPGTWKAMANVAV